MIRLENFSVGFGKKLLLNNINTEFSSGELTALIGRNGSGKSTLMKVLAGLNEKYGGEVYISDENLKDISRYKLATRLAYVNTQRPKIANLKCFDIVSLGRSPHTQWHGSLTQQDRDISLEGLRLVGMEKYADRYFNTLSDGESQKVMIARAIAQDTAIIILDEPTSFLDLPTRYEVVGLLKKLAKDFNKNIIFSTHELDIALEMSDKVALISDSRLYNLPVEEMIKSGLIQSLFRNDSDSSSAATADSFISRYLDFLLSHTS